MLFNERNVWYPPGRDSNSHFSRQQSVTTNYELSLNHEMNHWIQLRAIPKNMISELVEISRSQD